MTDHAGDPVPKPDCDCYWCSLLRAVQDEVARESPWCGTCNPAARASFLDSPEYRRAFERAIKEGRAGDWPVPTSLDPTRRAP